MINTTVHGYVSKVLGTHKLLQCQNLKNKKQKRKVKVCFATWH